MGKPGDGANRPDPQTNDIDRLLRRSERAKTPARSRSLEGDTDCDEKAAIYRGDLHQAHDSLLTNLKSHLIIRISKGQAIDGQPETNGGDYEDWGRARLQTGTT
jgi:hypothetical protein